MVQLKTSGVLRTPYAAYDMLEPNSNGLLKLFKGDKLFDNCLFRGRKIKKKCDEGRLYH